MYLLIEFYVYGYFDIGDGYCIYWECCGNLVGKFVVFLYGGFGVGCGFDYCCLFDFECYDILLFD